MAWPKGVSRKQRDAELLAAKQSGEMPPAIAQSLAAPKTAWKTDLATGMSTKLPAQADEIAPAAKKTWPAQSGRTVTLPDGRTFKNDDLKEADIPPPNLFSGRVKRLEVHPNLKRYPDATMNDPVPGHRLYWHHDVGMEIEKAFETGYRFVERDEIGLNDAPTSPGNNDLGTYVRRVVSDTGGPGNTPIFAFLMKKPQWLADKHDQDLERVHQQQEKQIRAGAINNQLPENVRHTPNVASISQDSSLYKTR